MVSKSDEVASVGLEFIVIRATVSERPIAKRRLGSSGPWVSAIGLGCMGMSGAYGPADDAESVETVRAALDAGINLLDTGDFYGMGHNELLLREALRGRAREQAILSVKFGLMRDPDGAIVGNDCRPQAVKNFLTHTLTRLGTDYVPARSRRPDRPDRGDRGRDRRAGRGWSRSPRRPLGGRAGHAAPSPRGPPDRRPPDRVLVGLEGHRAGDPADVPRARRCGHGLWRALPRADQRTLLEGPDSRAGRLPQLRPALRRREHRPQPVARRAASLDRRREGGNPRAQLAIAWVLARGRDVVTLVGARTRERLAETLGACEVELDAEDAAELEEALPADAVEGGRYNAQQMALLDSERS
jgi:aryl-alcohol dehydrogenase-like predicted oxidoreductase